MIFFPSYKKAYKIKDVEDSQQNILYFTDFEQNLKVKIIQTIFYTAKIIGCAKTPNKF